MKRAQRLEMVQNVVDDLERRRAEALALSEQRMAETETKLTELLDYQASYVRGFALRAQTGMDGAMARDYQVFLGRLEEAVRQQQQLVIRARVQRDSELRSWQGAAQRADAVGHIVKRFQAEEQREEDRREQLESDERAQRSWTFGLVASGA